MARQLFEVYAHRDFSGLPPISNALKRFGKKIQQVRPPKIGSGFLDPEEFIRFFGLSEAKIGQISIARNCQCRPLDSTAAFVLSWKLKALWRIIGARTYRIVFSYWE